MKVDCGVDVNSDICNLKPHESVPKGVATKQKIKRYVPLNTACVSSTCMALDSVFRILDFGLTSDASVAVVR